ncbi:tryptophan synthase beta subunit-like PLP-dependent enzyme [Aspergillus caelatus]|uniref:Tryptophan synthase beta subunit-like PLP-dependent enzyme n=1 Tax=Aspergillus caelatus TaxID=61420 RepID=A0A5N6ZQM3_9EURO|nr:tryptophan synthase beta subunit-like PLP-dependent enzyme [Aspergillus caelatus]KAE8359942.1 tryptophan synthase beta subunit-like PLP-dependent enzyme [Aspergillus caelatus]
MSKALRLAMSLSRSYPWVANPFIVSAPMRVMSGPALAVAVSRAGGLGFLGPAVKTQDMLVDLEKVSTLVDEARKSSSAFSSSTNVLPIGVGFQLWSDDLATAVSGIKKFKPCAAWLFAPKGEAKGLLKGSERPDVIVVQGSEAGGHGRHKDGLGLMTLLPEVVDALAGSQIPIFAAGGIADGRGAAAVLCLGADGVVMGTRFLASEEARISRGYQGEIVRATDGAASTTRTLLYNHLRGTMGWPEPYMPRTIINKSFIEHQAGRSFDELKVEHDQALKAGDAGWGPEGRLATYAGASIGLIHNVKDAATIVHDVREQLIILGNVYFPITYSYLCTTKHLRLGGKMQNSVFETAASAVQARNRIRSHIYQTPLIPSRVQGKSHGAKVLFKAENFQLTGSFKIRGAMSKMSGQPANGRLITASSGNHGIGAACAAQALSKDLTVVLPESVVPAKLEKIKSYGVNVILHGAETGLAEQYAQRLAVSDSYTYISPYNDPDIVAGQGTIGLEILEQCEEVDNVFVSMGGGGLISGIGAVVKALSPRTKVYGVSAINSKALAESMAAGHVVETEHKDTLADAVAGGIDTDTITLPLAMSVVDRVVECDEDEIKAAMKAMAFDENMNVEGSAALALAGFNKVAQQLANQTSVIVLCGANFDQTVFKSVVLDL